MIAPLAAAAQELGTSESLRLLDLPAAWVVVLIIAPVAVLLAWLAYARESIPSVARVALSLLRLTAFGLLLVILFRPVMVLRSEEVRPAEVLVLLDDSASMGIADGYLGDAAARAALAPFADGRLEDTSRLELARRALERQLAPQLREGEYELRTLRFAEDATPYENADELTARGRATHVGDALRRALGNARGHHVTDVILVSDGRSNGGSSPLDAARAAAAEGLPVHTVVVGDTRPERNVFVELGEAPSDVLEGDEISIVVRVAGRGTEGLGATRVMLEELDAEGRVARLVAEEPVTPSETGERVGLVAPAEGVRSGATVRRFRVSVPPLEDETLLDDNALEFSVRISPEKIRVLYVEGYPRWDYRYLKDLLKRQDQNLSAQIFLLSATPDFQQEHSPGLASLTEVPTDRKELLENYDVIILGDVNPGAISPDPAKCEEFQESLVEFVTRGGGVLFQAGEYENPRTYQGTKLEELMPVVLDAQSGLPYQGDTTRELRPTLEDPAAPHEVVRLHPDDAINRVLWEEERGLRGFYWYSPVNRAKPGSQVLLRHPSESGPYGRHPLLVVGYYPSGRTMFLALDSTWMWRYRYDERYHGRFWRNAIRWLALGRLRGGDRRFSLASQRTSYGLDERVGLEARVLDEDYRPSDAPVVHARTQGPDGDVQEHELLLVPGREGQYRASFEVDRPGLYQAWIEEGGERVASADFEVVLPSRESADPTPDPELLAAVAKVSGGKAVSLATLADLRGELPGGEERREPIASTLEDAWDNGRTLLVVLLLLSVEWVLRKRLELV
ncbi:MAG: hypothetical protein H6828_07565 [Planctomycetes bacterium]|nr:hypothetical protein [Planctomycetota bacterium]